MISTFQFWTSIGTLVGTIVDNFTSSINGRNSYLIPLGIIYIVPAIITVGLLIIPESPRWLLQNNKREKARKSLVWLRPHGSLVEEELHEMQAALDSEMELAQGAAIMDMFSNPIDRRRTILAVGAVSVQAASGAMYMIGKWTGNFAIWLSSQSDLMEQRTAHISLRWPISAVPSRMPAFSSVSALPQSS
jgi:MFS transporter, SP family, sugar:H+ symporter